MRQRRSIDARAHQPARARSHAFDRRHVRRLTAGLFQMLPRLSSELDFQNGMDPERAPAAPIPLHRGAKLYYRERELKR